MLEVTVEVWPEGSIIKILLPGKLVTNAMASRPSSQIKSRRRGFFEELSRWVTVRKTSTMIWMSWQGDCEKQLLATCFQIHAVPALVGRPTSTIIGLKPTWLWLPGLLAVGSCFLSFCYLFLLPRQLSLGEWFTSKKSYLASDIWQIIDLIAPRSNCETRKNHCTRLVIQILQQWRRQPVSLLWGGGCRVQPVD